LKITVTDRGVGIGQQDITRIFLPFQQGDHGPRHASGSGLGLGLSIAKAIVELHEGRIDTYSAGKDLGAQFTVELPLAATAIFPPVDLAAPATMPAPVSNRALQILLVEDHVDTGRIMTRLLKNAGYYVEYAADTTTALSLFQKDKFDLIVSDLGLPDESGLIMMQKLRALQPDLRGICMSGYGMENDLNDCKLAGFSEHITKPVDLQQLHAAINRVIGRSSVS
jgi:CheY-like chemotaxis protein